MRRLGLRWAAALAVGACIATAYWVYGLQNLAASVAERAWLPLYLLAVSTAGAYWLLFSVAWPRLPATTLPKALWALAACALSAAAVLVWPAPRLPQFSRLTVTATGQKRPEARGSEVWVEALTLPKGQTAPLADFQRAGNWEERDGSVMTPGGQPATLRWEGLLSGDGQLKLLKHPWSGVVQVQWNDAALQEYDLYADPAEDLLIDLPFASGPASPLEQTLRWTLVPTWGLLIFVAGAALMGRFRPGQSGAPRPSGQTP